jgi:chorismate mutase/prephenate dehydratase
LLSALDNSVAGAHYISLLEPFAKSRHQYDVASSRVPRDDGKWDYVFFIDIEGHAEAAQRAQAALEALKQQAASLFRVLGAYPRAVL